MKEPGGAYAELMQMTEKRIREIVLCPLCGGKGRVASPDRIARARKGGNTTYLKSLEPGQMSMRERGRRGGRPRSYRLDEADP